MDPQINYHYYYQQSNLGNATIIIFTTLQSLLYVAVSALHCNLDWWQLNFPLIVMVVLYLYGLYIQGFSTGVLHSEEK